VELQDGNHNASPLAADVTVGLTSDQTNTLFDDVNCTDPFTGISILTGSTSGKFYFKGASQGTVNLTANVAAPALTGTQSVIVGAPHAVSLAFVLPGQSLTGSAVTGVPDPQIAGVPFTVAIHAMNYNGTHDTTISGWTLGSITGGSLNIAPASSIPFDSNGIAVFTVTAPNEMSGASISASLPTGQGSATGNSGSFNVMPGATKYTVYMNQASAVKGGACQIFAIVPEDSAGAAAVTGVNMTVTSTSGTLYNDKDCSSVSSGVFAMGPADRMRVLFYQNAATSGTATIAASDGIRSGNLLVTMTSGTVTSAYKWQLLGMSEPNRTIGGRCLPYVAYLSDSAGMFVPPPSGDINNLSLHVTPIAGAQGAFYDSYDCSGGSLEGLALSLTASLGYRPVNASPPSSATDGQHMNVGETTTPVYQTNTFDLYRSD
jgi:hypothetical protein